MITTLKIVLFPAMVLLGGHLTAQELIPAENQSPQASLDRPYSSSEEREPCSSYDALRRPHFGDTHIHTALSFDARSQDTRNKPRDAYAFAKGGKMGIKPYDENDNPMRFIQLDRPLDFTAVTDHAEFMGEIRMCNTPGLPGYWHPVCITHRYIPLSSFGTFGAYGLAAKKR